MSSSKGKKAADGRRHKKKTPKPLDQLQPGMPSPDSITGMEEVRKGKKVFYIIHTTEVDEYERVAPQAQRRKHRPKSQ